MNSDQWRPTATLEMLRRRAEILKTIRQFFSDRDVLEVETPAFSQFANPDPNIESFSTEPTLDFPQRFFLHTSPEFPMKRLLAAGAGSIYQICKVFRRDPVSARHNPEFTMLEWYRPGFDYVQLMDEVSDLIQLFLNVKSEKLTYKNAFLTHCGLDITVVSKQQLQQFVREKNIVTSPSMDELDVQAWRDLIFSYLVEPKLGFNSPLLVHDFPVEAASLARIRSGDPPVAERFELFIKGYEIANGYTELIDAAEQRRRWERDLAIREKNQQSLNPVDHLMLSALESGLSPVSGVALGVDRLVMSLENCSNMSAVVAFPADRS